MLAQVRKGNDDEAQQAFADLARVGYNKEQK